MIDFKQFTADFQEAVAGIEQKYEIELSLGNITYDQYHFRTRLTATTKMNDAEKESRERAEFNKAIIRDANMKPSMFMTNYIGMDGKIYKVVGYNSRARKYPVIVEHNGQRMKCTTNFLRKEA